METGTATDILVRCEKLAKFLDLGDIDCRSNFGQDYPLRSKWEACTSFYLSKSGSRDRSNSQVGRTPEEALIKLENKLKDLSLTKIGRLTQDIEAAQEVIRFG